MTKRKLIEVALPLEAINRESARENYIYKGNPSSLHKWWAQRPLAAARAVLFAQLVDDPSSRPEEFPTEDLQREERDRLHRLIERLVIWENMRDEKLLTVARAEIVKSSGGTPPPILDPFAGGGTIPLEAQRLGLEAHASDLNPVAVLINKALIEYPATFVGQAPVFPGLADSEIRSWNGSEGLAADVRAYGAWIRDEALLRTGHMYPRATLPDGTSAPCIAWIWARTVICPNPACRIELPLVRNWWLSKRKGREAVVTPHVMDDPLKPSGLRVAYAISIGTDLSNRVTEATIGRTGGRCIACGTSVPLNYIRAEGRAGRIRSDLMAVVAEVNRRRTYLEANQEHVNAAQIARPDNAPAGDLPNNPRDFKTPNYGMTTWADLFTNRQLTVLTVLSDLVSEARKKTLHDGGSERYADAVATYLAFALSKILDYQNALTAWYPQEERPSHLFTRQAIPMLWDYVELAPFSAIGGTWSGAIDVVSLSVERLDGGATAHVAMADAARLTANGAIISTDPPYYDNIGYSDLSDFFYVWLRRTLRSVHPELLATLLVPKAEELVANPYRQGGKDAAESFFEDGFRDVFTRARKDASPDYPITVYYAFKQSEKTDFGKASTGWETLLEGMIRSGWEITSTWPLRSERGGRMISVGRNALASAIVLSLRPRPEGGATTDRRGFIAALETELPSALRRLQQGQIAPVDLPQAAIGPGMAVFSRYEAVLDPDGKKMTVRAALERINEVLDQVLNEQEGDFDTTSRFAIAWYRQHGYGIGKFGDADSLARARNTSVEVMDRSEILTSRAGNVQLIKPGDLSWDYDLVEDSNTSNWEVLHHLIKVLERDGIAPAGEFLHAALSHPDIAVDADLVKELAHLLFRIAEGNGWTKDALSFNTLVTSWPEILDVARTPTTSPAAQGAFDFEDDE
ncbi:MULTISPECIES: DUF1156 domain-containing protein [Rhodococcus]|uniref:DUF1156 domain-containing protein n=1 Tax=Rhodococcus TaxID=1827 RepID=UPI000E6B4AE6|nr:DUF1156 domain-containing protein [Rhodococcus ruber]AXY51428.1 hypothetical protein YT1_1994 [Rhodococcus ruber]RQM35839.1 hypothetical protein TN91_02560 [Rhodococcus ruber]